MQMSGWMGSGKSTIATAFGAETGAVVLDHDTTKTAVMAAGIAHPPAGAASYEVLFGLAADFLRQGHAVIIDSPAVYDSIPGRGLTLAAAAGVPYFFVDCDCPQAIAEERVAARPRRPSQVLDEAHASAVRADPSRLPHRPATGAVVVDTSRDLQACLRQIREYIATDGAAGPVIATTRD